MAAPVTAAAVTSGVLWMVASSGFYALTYTAIRELAETGFSVYQLVFIRATIGVMVMTPWLIQAGSSTLRTPRMRLYLLRAVVMYTGMLCWFYGLANLKLADATALMFTAPFFTLIFLSIFLGEAVGGRRWLAVAVGFGGALIVIQPGAVEFSLALGALLYTAVSYGASNALTRALAIDEDSNLVVFYNFALLVPLAVGPAAANWTAPGWADAPAIVAFGILSVAAMTCMTRSVAAAPGAVVMPLIYLQLPLVAVAGYVAYGESPEPNVWMGGTVICAAGYATTWAERRRARRAEG